MIPQLKNKLMSSSEFQDIGRLSYGCPKVVKFPSGGRLVVGSFCSIADEVTILLGGEHDYRRVSTFPFNALWENDELPAHEQTRGDVIIGNDVWIGYGCLILSGSQIGDGAVIGANSVVSGTVEPFAVVAGNPAELLRYRFDPDVVESLLDLRWWDWELDDIRQAAGSLSADAREFCATRKGALP